MSACLSDPCRRQAEKDRYVRTYAQGHISEKVLDVYLADLKNQTHNLRLLLASVEGEISRHQEQAGRGGPPSAVLPFRRPSWGW